MARWTRREIEHQINMLEPYLNSLSRAFWIDRTDERVSVWIARGRSYVKDLTDSTVDTLMNSTCFDHDLYDVLVDTLNIDAEAAARMCLNG